MHEYKNQKKKENKEEYLLKAVHRTCDHFSNVYVLSKQIIQTKFVQIWKQKETMPKET